MEDIADLALEGVEAESQVLLRGGGGGGVGWMGE